LQIATRKRREEDNDFGVVNVNSAHDNKISRNDIQAVRNFPPFVRIKVFRRAQDDDVACYEKNVKELRIT